MIFHFILNCQEVKALALQYFVLITLFNLHHQYYVAFSCAYEFQELSLNGHCFTANRMCLML